MKKTVLMALAFLSFSFAAFAYDTGHSSEGVFKRIGLMEKRGFLNVLGLPAELWRTPVDEAKIHPKLWPVTVFPRTVTNIVVRAVSAAYDIGLSPVVQPFSDDTSPLTETMGLPDYPWQTSDAS